MRVEIIEFSRKVYRIQDEAKIHEMMEGEYDPDKVSVLSHRFAELQEKKNA